jgi:hypothetical protein
MSLRIEALYKGNMNLGFNTLNKVSLSSGDQGLALCLSIFQEILSPCFLIQCLFWKFFDCNLLINMFLLYQIHRSKSTFSYSFYSLIVFVEIINDKLSNTNIFPSKKIIFRPDVKKFLSIFGITLSPFTVFFTLSFPE